MRFLGGLIPFCCRVSLPFRGWRSWRQGITKDQISLISWAFTPSEGALGTGRAFAIALRSINTADSSRGDGSPIEEELTPSFRDLQLSHTVVFRTFILVWRYPDGKESPEHPQHQTLIQAG